jgi:hypothetical protein
VASPSLTLPFPIASTCFISRSWDPIVDEAAMGATVDVPLHSCLEKVADMVD